MVRHADLPEGDADSILKSDPDIHYVFQMKPNGDLIFLEPYSIQKNITSFNYGFRDYLQLAKSYRSTALSEGYISNDEKRTQIITVANPIFDKNHKLSSIFAASVSSETLRKNVFMKLQKKMAVNDGTTFYLIDRHAHVVASSSGKNIYFPIADKKNDDEDPGNLRDVGFFKNITWHKDMFEEGNRWQRNIGTWSLKSLKPYYRAIYNNINNEEVIGTFYPTNLGGTHSENWGILVETPLNQILSSQYFLAKVFLIVGLLLLVVLITLFIFTIKIFSKLEWRAKQKETELKEMASQLAHDIRSPLVAFDMAVKQLEKDKIEESKRVTIHNAVTRINDIANNLISKYKAVTLNKNIQSKECTPTLIAQAINGIVSEKRTQYISSNVHFMLDSDEIACSTFSQLDGVDFNRAISNLIDNSVEAIKDNGQVKISLRKMFDKMVIKIIDDGCGIKPNLIQEVLKRGVSEGKKNGSGLGLSFAKTRIEDWGGELELNSEYGKGTTVVITLPVCQSPDWFMDRLTVFEPCTFIVLDDDESIHGVWDDRIKSASTSINKTSIIHYNNPEELINDYHQLKNKHENLFFLMDYELIGFEINGLDVIEKLGIANQSLLVTSYTEDHTVNILTRCRELNVKAIPKQYALYIPIKIINKNPDLVLIDDNEELLQQWYNTATDKGMKIAVFNNVYGFIRISDKLSKIAKVYIDSELGEKLKGEDFAKQIYDLGFKEIYLCTGYDNYKFKSCSWIKEVVGKSFPIFD